MVDRVARIDQLGFGDLKSKRANDALLIRPKTSNVAGDTQLSSAQRQKTEPAEFSMPNNDLLVAVLFALLSVFCRPVDADTGNKGTWGDQRDGSYKNPILPGDFSDPDVMRVGTDYYLITSTFQFSPGMAVLHSKDLVNWQFVGHCVDDLKQISSELNWDRMNRYNRGIYAGSIRFHDGRFWVFFTTLDEGIFMTTAVNPAGSWQPLRRVSDLHGTDDACPFWDDDGQAYLIYSTPGLKWFTHLVKMSADGTTLQMPTDSVLDNFQTSEGNKSINSIAPTTCSIMKYAAAAIESECSCVPRAFRVPGRKERFSIVILPTTIGNPTRAVWSIRQREIGTSSRTRVEAAIMTDARAIFCLCVGSTTGPFRARLIQLELARLSGRPRSRYKDLRLCRRSPVMSFPKEWSGHSGSGTISRAPTTGRLPNVPDGSGCTHFLRSNRAVS